MAEGETYLEKARSFFESVERIYQAGSYGPTDFEQLGAMVGLAQAETSLILAESQRLLTQTLEEANRLKRIELGLENPQPGGVANVHDSIPDLSGQSPPDAPAR